ncbi:MULTISPECIES: hypothetical protein, partial [Chromobacterium]
CQSGRWKKQAEIPEWHYVEPTIIYSEAMNKPARELTTKIQLYGYVPLGAKFVSITTVIANGQNFCDGLFMANVRGKTSTGEWTVKNIPIKTYNQSAWYADAVIMELPIYDGNIYFHHPYICGDTYGTGGANVDIYLNGFL